MKLTICFTYSIDHITYKMLSDFKMVFIDFSGIQKST